MSTSHAQKAGSIVRNAFLLTIIMILAACQSGFSEADIDNVKNSIRTEFEKKEGVKVVEVQMIKESPKKLTGFVKAKVSILGIQREMTKNCSATWGEGNQYLWRCD